MGKPTVLRASANASIRTRSRARRWLRSALPASAPCIPGRAPPSGRARSSGHRPYLSACVTPERLMILLQRGWRPEVGSGGVVEGFVRGTPDRSVRVHLHVSPGLYLDAPRGAGDQTLERLIAPRPQAPRRAAAAALRAGSPERQRDPARPGKRERWVEPAPGQANPTRPGAPPAPTVRDYGSATSGGARTILPKVSNSWCCRKIMSRATCRLWPVATSTTSMSAV